MKYLLQIRRKNLIIPISSYDSHTLSGLYNISLEEHFEITNLL
jgi:hypothetical protein